MTPSLPHSLEVERALLGYILLDNSALAVALEGVSRDDFYSLFHRLIFDAIVGLAAKNQVADIVTVGEVLATAGTLESAGGAARLAALTDGVPLGGTSAVTEYARVIHEKAVLRRIINACYLTVSKCSEGLQSPQEILDEAVGEFTCLESTAGLGESPKTFREAAASLLAMFDKGTLFKINTGIGDLDKITGGFLPGESILYVAETGTGKTLFAQQTRLHSCQQSLHGLFACGEMTAEQLIARELATDSGVERYKMRAPERLTPEDWAALTAAAPRQCDRCVILDGEITMARVVAQARRMKSENRLALVVVDYDELVSVPGRDDNERLAAVAAAAKHLAVSLAVPVILISQVRKLLSQEDRQFPTLDRLYGSGAKSKHASIVIFIARKFLETMDPADQSKARLFILKNRNGILGYVDGYFDVSTLRFRAVEKRNEDAPPEDFHDRIP